MAMWTRYENLPDGTRKMIQTPTNIPVSNYRPDITGGQARWEMFGDEPYIEPQNILKAMPQLQQPQAPAPAPSSGGGGGGGGGAPARAPASGGTWAQMWGEYTGLKDEFGNLKNTAAGDFNKIRQEYDKNIAGMPQVGMVLPDWLGGSQIPLAPGKWEGMYSNIANTQGGLANSKLSQMYNALSGQGQLLGDMLGYDTNLKNIDLGYANLANQMGIAQGGWQNALDLQNLRNDSASYLTQQKINENDYGSDWLIPGMYLAGQGVDWLTKNWDTIGSIFA